MTTTFLPNHKGSIIRRLGNLSITTFARTVRALTGHGPTGAYRARFRPKAQEPTLCTCGFSDPPPVQSHYHITFECPMYYRGNFAPAHLLELDPFPLIRAFLQVNPTAFMFDDLP
ncbi:hypothetical protein BD309DRAFT_868805, partial [Dichomitus squalens]